MHHILGHIPRRSRAAAAAILATAPFLLLASCSSGLGTDTPSNGNSSPTSAVEVKAMEPIRSWPGPTDPVDPPAGVNLTILSCGSVASGCVLASDAAKDAAEELGWSARIIDGRLDPNTWNNAARQAATDNQDALIMVATNPALMQDGLAEARDAGVRTVLTFQPESKGADVDSYVTTDHAAGGAVLGQFIGSDSGSDAHVLVLDAPEYPEAAIRNDAVVEELETQCPECAVTRQDFSAATMVQRLAGQVSSQLQQHPDINYVFTPFDAAGAFVAQGIRQAGKSATVRLVGAEGTPDSFERIQTGSQVATLVGSPGYVGWLAVDQVARLLDGQDTDELVNVPQRLIVKDNLSAIGDDGSWQLDLDYQSEFKKLWNP